MGDRIGARPPHTQQGTETNWSEGIRPECEGDVCVGFCLRTKTTAVSKFLSKPQTFGQNASAHTRKYPLNGFRFSCSHALGRCCCRCRCLRTCLCVPSFAYEMGQNRSFGLRNCFCLAICLWFSS